MKRLIMTMGLVLLSLGLLVGVVLAAVYGDIIVSGGGFSSTNGTYAENGTFNSKVRWAMSAGKGTYDILWGTTTKQGAPVGWWIVYNEEGIEHDSQEWFTVYYYNAQATDQPPATGWTSKNVANDPPPTLSGDGSLPVKLRLFRGSSVPGGVQLFWVTESEVDNIGFILERAAAPEDGDAEPWQTLASYLTHEALRVTGDTSERTEYGYLDTGAVPGTRYFYRLSDVDTHGTVSIDDVIAFTLEPEPVLENTVLRQAYPNPFNPSTKIQYDLSTRSTVTLKVVDMLGRQVQTLISGQQQAAGTYSVHWNGMDENGVNAGSGVYFLVLQAGDMIQSQKVMLVR